MEALGRINPPGELQFHLDSRDRVRPHIVRWMKEQKKVRIFLTFDGVIIDTKSGGIIVVASEEAGDCQIETWYRRRTLTQLATLKSIESLLYWAHNGMFPPTSTLLDGFHEVIVDSTGIHREDPASGKTVRVSTSSHLCTTVDMNKFIETAVQFVLDADIPHTMYIPAAEMNFQKLYREWYKIRSLEPDMDDITWEEYCRRFPYDEFNCIGVTDGLQKMHIVSVVQTFQRLTSPGTGSEGLNLFIYKFSISMVGHQCCRSFPTSSRRWREPAKLQRKEV